MFQFSVLCKYFFHVKTTKEEKNFNKSAKSNEQCQGWIFTAKIISLFWDTLTYFSLGQLRNNLEWNIDKWLESIVQGLAWITKLVQIDRLNRVQRRLCNAEKTHKFHQTRFTISFHSFLYSDFQLWNSWLAFVFLLLLVFVLYFIISNFAFSSVM